MVCRDEDGELEAGVVVTLELTAVPAATGGAFSTARRTATSDVDGVASFTGLFEGGTYSIRRGTGTTVEVTIPVGADDPYDIASMLGRP